MIKLYLVRHGETDGNAQQWYQGSTDVPLNARGIVQAKYLGDFLKDEQFTAVYSSDLLRAEKTAELVAAPHRLPVTTYAELREINFGEWEGHTYNEIIEQWPGEIETFYESDGTMRARGGESFAEVEERAMTKIRDILANHGDGDTVLVVSHGATIRCLIFGLLGLKLTRVWCFQQFNTAFNIIDYYGTKNVMTVMNSTRHLEGTEGHQEQWSSMVSL